MVESKSNLKSERELAHILNEIPFKLLREASPNSLILKRTVKFPMISMIAIATSIVAISIIFIKLCLELITGGHMKEYAGLCALLFFLCIVAVFLNMGHFNWAMSMYPQMEVLPTY